MANLTDPKVLITVLTLSGLAAAGAGGYVMVRELGGAPPPPQQSSPTIETAAPPNTLTEQSQVSQDTLDEFDRIKAEQRRLESDRNANQFASAQAAQQNAAELEALRRERENLEAARRALEEQQRNAQRQQTSVNPVQTPSVNFNAAPTFGAANLVSGFTPDPHNVAVQSGGNINASTVASGCVGYIASAPDMRLNFTGGNYGLPLIIGVNSSADTTLVIYAPNGGWYCNDDSDSLNPAVRFNQPQSGAYYVWVGTYGQTTYFDATLRVSEVQ